MQKFPPIVSIFITSRCNNNCKHCFAPKNVKEMSFPKLKKLFAYLHKKGVRAILLGGGEPLLRNDFKDILKELNKYKFKIFLDTSGDLFFKYRNQILKYIDVIGLPMDFPDSSYRNKNNLKAVLNVLDSLKTSKIRPLIRIGTVITKDNFKRLEEIGELLKIYPVDIWKIYQFTPQNYNALKNKAMLEISQKDFDKTTKRIKKQFSRNFEVIISKRKDRSQAYFFITSDGNVSIPIDDLNICRQVEIGNVFDKDILSKWEKFYLKKYYIKNAEITFRFTIKES